MILTVPTRSAQYQHLGHKTGLTPQTRDPKRYGLVAVCRELDLIESATSGSRHRDLFASSCRVGNLVGAGLVDEAWATRLVLERAEVLGLPDSDRRRQVARGIERGKRTPRVPRPRAEITNNGEAREAVLRWWQRVANDPRVAEGRRGPMRLRILATFRDNALTAGRIELDESLRELAEAAGVSLGTIHNYRDELAPWVKVVRSDGRRLAHSSIRTRWRLHFDAGSEPDPEDRLAGPLLATSSSDRDEIASRQNDQWHAWAGGWLAYGVLDADEAQTASEIAQRIGKGAGSVRRTLARLARAGLAVRDELGRWTSTSARTAPEPTYERPRQRHKRHEAERELQRLRVAALIAELEAREEPDLLAPSSYDRLRARRRMRPRRVLRTGQVIDLTAEATRLLEALQ